MRIRVFSPREIGGQPSFCAGVGAAKLSVNHRLTAG
jgi:hypothetical protein